MANFDEAVENLLSDESDEFIANDHGRGCCKFGITLLTAREIYPHCSADDIARMDRAQAKRFYHMWAWVKYGIGRIENQAVASKALNLAVNIGPPTFIKLLQGIVGVRCDGVLGPATSLAVNKYDAHKLLHEIRHKATLHYVAVVTKNPSQWDDLLGWLLRLKKNG